MYPEFFRLVRRMQQRHAQLWAAGDIPITRVQFVALRTLVGKPGIEPVELARLLEIDKATLAGVLSGSRPPATSAARSCRPIAGAASSSSPMRDESSSPTSNR